MKDKHHNLRIGALNDAEVEHSVNNLMEELQKNPNTIPEALEHMYRFEVPGTGEITGIATLLDGTKSEVEVDEARKRIDDNPLLKEIFLQGCRRFVQEELTFLLQEVQRRLESHNNDINMIAPYFRRFRTPDNRLHGFDMLFDGRLPEEAEQEAHALIAGNELLERISFEIFMLKSAEFTMKKPKKLLIHISYQDGERTEEDIESENGVVNFEKQFGSNVKFVTIVDEEGIVLLHENLLIKRAFGKEGGVFENEYLGTCELKKDEEGNFSICFTAHLES